MKATALVHAAPALWKTFGGPGLRQRAVFELRKATGQLRRQPSDVRQVVMAHPLPEHWPFIPNADRVRASTRTDVAIDRARRVAEGEHEAYRWDWRRRPLAPRDWSTHPVSGFVYDANVPWFHLPHFSGAAGDIKDVWEAGRFAWAYDLARGWIVSGDDRYADTFWRALEIFREGCPPFLGVQWSCGQETAIRAIAWLWAEGALDGALATTDARRAALRESLVWSAERIEDALGYAISQRNNHGLSEATALVAIGARFRDAEPRAARWLALGRQRLDRLVEDQIEPDGWYIQHSFTYLRLALDQLVTARRALVWAGADLSVSSLTRIRAAIRMLGELVDVRTGSAPNHGPNDGAYVLPLSTRCYRDMVPGLTAAAATFGEPLPPGMSAEGETLAWLDASTIGERAADALPIVRSGASGWVDARTSGARVFARAGQYRTRPGHIDPLHVDIWIDGKAVAVDAGTYRYAAAAPWNNGLACIEVHNTLSIEAHPAAVRGPRFLWLRWPASRILAATKGEGEGDTVRIEMMNESWKELGITHRRICAISARGVTVADEVIADATFDAPICVQWLIGGDATDVATYADVPAERLEARGDDRSVLGWISDGYGAKRRATSVRVIGRPVAGCIRVVSGFGDQRAPERLRAALASLASH